MYFLANRNNPNELFHTLRKLMAAIQPVFDVETIELICSESRETPPLLFVDVDQPNFDFNLLSELQGHCYTVAIDGHYKHVQQCIQYAADLHLRDYLSLPLQEQTISQCLERYQQWLEDRKLSSKNNLIIKEKGAHIYSETSTIKLLEGLGSYTRIHTSDKVYIVSKTIKKILEQLPNQFIRTHRSFAVHQKQVRSLVGNMLLLQNGEFVKVSKSGRQVVLEHFNKAS